MITASKEYYIYIYIKKGTILGGLMYAWRNNFSKFNADDASNAIIFLSFSSAFASNIWKVIR